MSTDTSTITPQKPAIEFKSSTFAVPALIVNSIDLTQINEKITIKIKQAPEFFKNSPILIDIAGLSDTQPAIQIPDLIKLIRDKALVPIALRGGNAEQNAIALNLGLFIQPAHGAPDGDKSLQTPPMTSTKQKSKALSDTSVAAALHSPFRTNERRKNQDSSSMSKLITTPVRSGQRVYAEGDLIVMAQVSAGAEIMAEGNIHVYGSLRGRALAGVLGKPDCRIFCFDCQAELIAIAGNYKVNDDLDPDIKHKPVQIYLQEHTLVFKEL